MNKPARLATLLISAFLTASASIVGAPITGAAASTAASGPATVHGWRGPSKVDARTAVAQPHSGTKRTYPFLSPQRSAGGAQTAPATSRTGSPQIATGSVVENLTTWAADSLSQQVSAFPTDQSAAPPDSGLAVSGTKVVEWVNSSGWVYDKSGNQLASYDLNVLLNVPGGYSETDPRIVYDPVSDRWYGTSLAFNGSLNAIEFVAVSATNDPAGVWYTYDYVQGDLGDQPRIGVSTDKLQISWDEYQTSTTGAFVGEQNFVFSKASIMTGGAPNVVGLGGGGPVANVFAVVPAILNTANGNIYSAYNNADPTDMVQNQAGPTVAIWTVSGSISSLSWTAVYRTVGSLDGALSPAVPQSGTAALLNPDDDRVTEVGLSGNLLWVGLNVPCTPGEVTVRACLLYWRESLPGTGSTNDTLVFGETGKYVMYPSIAFDSAGDMLSSFTMSSGSDSPSLQATGVKAGSSSFTSAVTLLAGTGFFSAACSADPLRGGTTDCRWGDYTAAIQDPNHLTDAWVTGEYQGDGTDHTDWGTGISRLTYSVPDIVSVSPSSGSDCTPLTVFGTDFTPTTTVDFNTTPAAHVTYNSPQSLTVTPPILPGGTYDVIATSDEGSSATSAADHYDYVGPVVTGVSPSSGGSGTSVTITGCGFTGTLAAGIQFGGVAAGGTPVVSDTSITGITSPSGPTGTVDVTVTNQGTTSATSCADQYTYGAAGPTVTNVTPAAGPETGATVVTITGSGFGCAGTNNVTGVTIGGNAALSFTVNSSTSITATTPAKTPGAANAADVSVTDSTATGTETGGFTYLPTYLFTWFDRISSPGFKSDNIHVVNPNGSAATANLFIPGCAPQLNLNIPANSEAFYTCPTGFGGPVTLWSTLPVVASQRVQFFQSFNETPAQSYDNAGLAWQFAWFDRISDPGFTGDNIHVMNPGTAVAHVTVHIPGSPACDYTGAAIAIGAESYFGCNTGFGGPVTVTSDVPVLASQRVEYYQSFNEELGQATAGATNLQFSWYDHASSVGFKSDNLHVWDPTGSALDPAALTVTIPGCSPTHSTGTSASELIYSCPFGSGFGGPATITTTGVHVLASQRVQYYQTFNEVPGTSPGQAGVNLYFAWFDRISDPGFKSDNIHIWNTSGSDAHVTVTIPGCADQLGTITPGTEMIFTCSGGFGGPVHIVSDVSVLASQRVQYYSSFNEVLAANFS